MIQSALYDEIESHNLTFILPFIYSCESDCISPATCNKA